MPPPARAELPLTLQPVIVSVQSVRLLTPPPFWQAELPLTMQLLRINVLEYPELSAIPPPDPEEELPLMVQFVSVFWAP